MSMLKKLMEEEKKRKENEASTGGGYTAVDYGEKTSLKLKDKNDFRIIRLMGSFKRIFQSEIWDDEDKRRKPILPPEQGNGDHILWKAIKIMQSKDWDKAVIGADGKKKAPFIYAAKYPELFNMVQHNNQAPFIYEGKPIENKGWYPAELMLWNCIDRHLTDEYEDSDNRKALIRSYDYCAEQKKCKLISKDGFNSGVAYKSFNGEIDAMVAKYPPKVADTEELDLFGYDIAITKGSQTTVPYSISMADDRVEKYQKFIKLGGITEEERGYTLIDLETISKVTPQSVIHKYLEKKLKKLFYAIGDGATYDKWVKEVVEPEKEEFRKQKESENKNTKTFDMAANTPVSENQHPLTQDEPTTTTVTPTPSRRQVVSESVEAPKTNTLVDKLKHHYPKMNELDYQWVSDVTDAGTIVWREEAGTAFYEWKSAEFGTTFQSPEKVKYDPISGEMMW